MGQWDRETVTQWDSGLTVVVEVVDVVFEVVVVPGVLVSIF